MKIYKGLIILLFCLQLNFSLQAQNCNYVDNDFYQKTSPLKHKLDTTLDYSPLIIPDDVFLGFINLNYKKMNIFYNKVTRIDWLKYKIEGYSNDGSSVNRYFQGYLLFLEVGELENYQYGIDSIYKDSLITFQGKIKGSYIFEEDTSYNFQPGFFEGDFLIDFIIINNVIKKNKITKDSDGYRNNQYQGTYYSRKINKKTVCNWGEYRIPCSGDLDLGVSEFSPNPKYHW